MRFRAAVAPVRRQPSRGRGFGTPRSGGWGHTEVLWSWLDLEPRARMCLDGEGPGQGRCSLMAVPDSMTTPSAWFSARRTGPTDSRSTFAIRILILFLILEYVR